MEKRKDQKDKEIIFYSKPTKQMETIKWSKTIDIITPQETTHFDKEWFSWDIYVNKDAKKWFTILRITVHGSHPLKKMIGDTTRTYYVESWMGEFTIDGIKHNAIPGNLFIIEPGHQYEYTWNMILMETNISWSNAFKDELINTLEKK